MSFDIERLKQYPLYKDVEWVQPVSKMPEYKDLSDYMSELAQGLVPLPMTGLGGLKGTNMFEPGAPLGSNSRSRMIGNPDLVQRNGVLRMKSAGGWGYKRSTYRDARRLFSPIEIKCGDLCSNDTLTGVPAWINDSGADHANVDNQFFRMWHNTTTQPGGSNPYRNYSGVRSTLRHTGVPSWYCDLCLPIFPDCNFQELDLEGTQVQSSPLTVRDLFGRVSNTNAHGGHYDWSLAAWGGGPYFLDNQTSNSSLEKSGNFTLGADTQHCFVQLETEIRLFNHLDKAQNYDIYLCEPRSVTDKSPLYIYDQAYKNSLETNPGFDASIIVNGGEKTQVSHKLVGSSPTQYRDFNQQYRTKKRTVTLAPGHCVVFKLRLPLSLVKSEIVNKLKGSHAAVSIPGLTQWFWIRAYGNLGYDNATSTGGTGRGIINVQYFQKIRVLYSIPHIKKKVNVIRPPGFDISPDENLVQGLDT